MAGNLRSTLAVTVALCALTAACGKGPALRSVPPVPTPRVNKVLADVISPTLDHNYIFGKGTPPVDFQPGSTTLVDRIQRASGLHKAALKSTKDSAAVLLIENDPKVAWGTLLRPAERTIFEQFAANPDLGDWLILLTDVIVAGPRDPVPLTAYRWARADVEQYVSCGIPKSGQNACSSKFFEIARTVVLQKPAAAPHGD